MTVATRTAWITVAAVVACLAAGPASAQAHRWRPGAHPPPPGWQHGGARPVYPYWGGFALGLGIGLGAPWFWGGPYYGWAYGPPPTVIVEPAPTAGYPVNPVPPTLPEPIYYPRSGQSDSQREADLRECNRWATTQAAAMAEATAFQRAVLACMDARGYTGR